MKKLSKNRLIIMAHPDDPELACGGSITQWAQQDDVCYIIVSCGEKGTRKRGDSPLRIAHTREQEAKKAARFLGVKKVIFLRHPDGEIGNVATLKLEIAALIRRLKPYSVVTHDPWLRQFHPDHRATGFAVINAVMIARDWHFYPFLLECGLDVHRPGELLFTPTDNPNVINDISTTLTKKIKAIKMHTSQLRQLPQWERRITMRAVSDGKPAGYTYGEGFYKMRV
jgi:LmbE family N-acetylglucosaminyl deacetylase